MSVLSHMCVIALSSSVPMFGLKWKPGDDSLQQVHDEFGDAGASSIDDEQLIQAMPSLRHLKPRSASHTMPEDQEMERILLAASRETQREIKKEQDEQKRMMQAEEQAQAYFDNLFPRRSRSSARPLPRQPSPAIWKVNPKNIKLITAAPRKDKVGNLQVPTAPGIRSRLEGIVSSAKQRQDAIPNPNAPVKAVMPIALTKESLQQAHVERFATPAGRSHKHVLMSESIQHGDAPLQSLTNSATVGSMLVPSLTLMKRSVKKSHDKEN